jgi:hypothetical protein
MPHPEVDVSRGDALAFKKREDAPKSVHKPSEGNARRVSRQGLEGAPESAHEISGYGEVAPQRRLEVDLISELKGGLGPYEVLVTSPQLKTEIGTGLIDTGAQVSLVRESSLRKSIPPPKKKKYRYKREHTRY